MQSEKAAGELTETEKLLDVARQRFEQAVEAEQDIRKLALEDLEFGAGNQWDPKDKQARALHHRPCLTINRLPQFIRQIVNDQRQNRPAIKVSPVDDQADIETAKVLQGIVRHIESASDAEIAYDTAFDSAVRTGFGYFRIRTEYCDPTSFDLDIRIEPIKNRFSVYLDPSYRLPDGSDANWGFIFDEITKEEFEALYPDADMKALMAWADGGEDRKDWITETHVRIAEYFYKEFKDVTLLKLSDGRTVVKEELPTAQVETGEMDEEGALILKDEAQLPVDEMTGLALEVVDQRRSRVPIVKHIKTNGKDILEQTDWPGKWIPIIPVLGEEIDINGKRILEGVIRHAKDSQRMLNYTKSGEAEAIALSPKAPWLIAEGQLEGYEGFWKTANTATHAYLPYKPMTLGGVNVPPPQRNQFEAPIQALAQAAMGASEDLKATTGIYDAALGNRSNENSGVAIQRRAAQAQTSNFHFVDNLSRSIRHCGRQLVDLIPKVIDVPRAQRILGEDGSEEVVRLYEKFPRKGQETYIDLKVGKYDVSVATGPSYETKRQEASASMLELAKIMPQMQQGAADLLVKNLDLPGAQELAERLKKMLPPGLVDDPEKKPLPPEAQAQMQQMSQMIEGLTAKLNEAQSQLETKKMELDSRERIEAMKLENQAAIKLAELQSGEALRLLQLQIAELDQRTKQAPYIPQNQVPNAPPVADGPPAEPVQQPTGGFSPGEIQE